MKNRIYHVFNPEANGGEVVCFTTYLDAEMPGKMSNQTFELGSYGNSATIELNGCIPPSQFRELANQLDEKFAKIQARYEQTPPPKSPQPFDEHYFTFKRIPEDDTIVALKTTYYDNGDANIEGVYTNQHFIFHHQNKASINLCGATITPTALRELANKLDQKLAML